MRSWQLLVLFVPALVLACHESKTPDAVETEDDGSDYVRVVDDVLWQDFEPELRSLVQSQKWFKSASREADPIVHAVHRAATTATYTRLGQPSVAAILGTASTQSWYADGLDSSERRTLVLFFNAFTDIALRLKNRDFTADFQAAIRESLFETISLPESGGRLLIGMGPAAEARRGLTLAKELLPQVETIVGPYPYGYLIVRISDEIKPDAAGVTNGPMISVRPGVIDRGIVAHELTHATIGGQYEFWFQEGIAHFVEYYVQGLLEEATGRFERRLVDLNEGRKIKLTHPIPYVPGEEERAQGFLLLKDAFDIGGIETITRSTRILRDAFRNSYEVLVQFPKEAPTGDQAALLLALVCSAVNNDYCRASFGSGPTLSPADEAASMEAIRKSLTSHGFRVTGEPGQRAAFVDMVLRAERNALAPRMLARPLAVLNAVWDADWIKDGTDEEELRALTVLFAAYSDALSRYKDRDPTEEFVEAVKNKLFRWVTLPESGRRLVIASAAVPDVARNAIDLASEQLPRVEDIIGSYTWPYVFVRVTNAVSNGDGQAETPFIDVAPAALNTSVLPREFARAAYSGRSDVWIREGITQTTAALVLDEVGSARTRALAVLSQAGKPNQIDLSFKGLDYVPTPTERAQEFLFMLGIAESIGIDAFGRLTRSWRGRSISNPIFIIFEQALSPSQRGALARVYCMQANQRSYCGQ